MCIRKNRFLTAGNNLSIRKFSGISTKTATKTPNVNTDLPPKESEQYQKVIKMLTNKVNTLSTELKVSEAIRQEQTKIINAYKIKDEKEAKTKRLRASKVKQVRGIAHTLAERELKEKVKQLSCIEQLRKENEILRKILKVQNEHTLMEKYETDIKNEEKKLSDHQGKQR